MLSKPKYATPTPIIRLKVVYSMISANLDKLRYHEKTGKSTTSLYEKHIRRILADITSDALTWTLLTPDLCLLECVLLHSGELHLRKISRVGKTGIALVICPHNVELRNFCCYT